MIFYKSITICNLFAYYGKQSVDFEAKDGKPLYLIYGNNGFGKTSFIRSMKLLFLGSGLNKGEVPSAISNFVDKNRGKFTPKVFLLGSGGEKIWEGALNKQACSEEQNEYFVELLLEQDGSEITIKRSWKKFPDLQETFLFIQNGRTFENEEAQEMCERLLPSQFVEFFIFDGEEIEAMADEISTELKEKIQNMLNISVLDTLISQTEKLKSDLTGQNFRNKEDRNKYKDLLMEIDSKNRNKDLKQNELDYFLREKEKLENSLTIASEKRDALIKNSGKEEAQIQKDIQTAKNNIDNAQNQIKSSQEEVLFIGLDELMKEICERLADVSNVSNLSQEELEKLCDFSAEYLHENHYKDISVATLARQLNDTFDKFLTNSSQDKIFGSISGLIKFKEIYQGTIISQKLFTQSVLSYKANNDNLKDLQRRLDDTLANQSIQNNIKSIDEEILTLRTKISSSQNEISSLEQALNDLSKSIADCETDIAYLEDKIKRDDRISEKLEIAEILIENFKNYKQERINLITRELKTKVLSYYKKLITNDNVCSIEIADFALSLKNANNEVISAKNQSAGQKQAISISIFWALSELSGRYLPLIIDTPLARMDTTNRSNIIQNYYFNASNQIIVLPHDGEFRHNEYEVAKDKIASIYKIKNSENRSNAYIENCEINEILGE